MRLAGRSSERERPLNGVEGLGGDGDASQARLVAAYAVVERHYAVKDDKTFAEMLAAPEPEPEPRDEPAKPVSLRNRRATLARRR